MTNSSDRQERLKITMGLMRLSRLPIEIVGYLVLALLMAPALSETFDLTLLTAAPSRWLQWHQNLFGYWKFGAPYAFLNAGSFCMHFYLAALGLTPVVAQHVATKTPMVIAGLFDGVLLSKLAPEHLSRRIRAAWLLSPVVLWVAAGQPQVEPLSVAGLLLALYLARREHLMLAAFVAVIGASFEYFPLAYFAIPILLCASLRAQAIWGVVWRTLVGAVLGIIVGFPQALFSTVDRHALLNGIASTQQTALTAPVKSDSIWYLVSHFNPASDLARLWPAVFVGISLFVVLIAVLRLRHRYLPDLATAVVAILVILSVILEPESLPTFSAIAAMAMLLLVMCIDISLVVAALIPVAGLASWFFQDPWSQFTADVNPAGRAHVWFGIPTSNAISAGLGALYAFGLLGVVIISLSSAFSNANIDIPTRLRTQTVVHSRRAGIGAIGIIGLASAYLAALGGQAVIATGLTGSQPSALFDAPFLLYNQSEQIQVVTRGEDVEMEAIPKTVKLVSADARSVVSVSSVGTVVRSFTLPARFTNALRGGNGVMISTWSVTFLAHHEQSDSSLTDARLQMAGRLLSPASASDVLPHWEFVTFAVPTDLLVAVGPARLLGRNGPNHETFLNGGKAHVPYIRIVALAGSASISAGHRVVEVFSLATYPIGVLGLQLPASSIGPSGVVMPIALCNVVDCSTLVGFIRWPSQPWQPALDDWRVIVLALGAVLACVGLAIAMVRVSHASVHLSKSSSQGVQNELRPEDRWKSV